MNVKPGYKTTEFWMTVLMHAITLLQLSGLFPKDSGWTQAISLIGSMLSQWAYTNSRGLTKSSAPVE
jgi:hypothetical protein